MKVINITFQNKNSLPTHQQFYGTWNNKDFKHRKYTLFDFASFLNYDFPPIMGNLALLEMLCLSPSKIEIVGCDFYQGLKENPDDFKSIWPSGYHGGKDPMLKSLSHKDTKYEHMDMFITIYLAINKGYRENTLHTQLVISDRLKEIINKRKLIHSTVVKVIKEIHCTYIQKRDVNWFHCSLISYEHLKYIYLYLSLSYY